MVEPALACLRTVTLQLERAAGGLVRTTTTARNMMRLGATAVGAGASGDHLQLRHKAEDWQRAVQVDDIEKVPPYPVGLVCS